MSQNLTDFNRGVIVGLRLSGLSISNTYKELQQNDLQGSERTIERVYSDWKNDGKTKSAIKSNSGRKKCLTQDSLNSLVQSIRDNPFQSRKDLENNPISNPQAVSGQTLVNNLKQIGCFQYSIQRKIQISDKNKELRIKWARSLLRNQRKTFKQTVFTDETIITFQNDRRTLAWSEQDKNKDKLVRSYQRWPPKVMIWGAIHYNGNLNIQFVEGSLNQQNYIKILKEFFQENEQDFEYFMQDNASCHNGKEVKKYFENQEIKVMKWVAQSPDVNPIEKVWNLLKQKLSKIVHEIDDFDVFKEKAKELFLYDKDMKKLTMKAIDDIPKVLTKIIESKGEAIN